MPTTHLETSLAIRNILFATDFTESSRKAFKYAKALTRHFQASITSAHVMRATTLDWPKYGIDPEYKKLHRDLKRDLNGLCSQLHQAGLKAERVLLEGDPVEG